MEKTSKKQKMRFSDGELDVIKSVYADNDDLIIAIRKSFLQIPLDAIDRSALDNAFKGKPDSQKVLRKTFLPEIDPNAPINQVIDLWLTVQFTDKTPEQAFPHLVSRNQIINYIEQQLNVLFKGEDPKIIFSDLTKIEGKTPFETFVDMITRNTIVTHTEMQLNQLSVLAGFKAESVEETKKRLAKDSTK